MNSPDGEIFPYRYSQFPILRPLTVLGASRLVIMYHGSLVERNGLDLAVEALALVRNTISLLPSFVIFRP